MVGKIFMYQVALDSNENDQVFHTSLQGIGSKLEERTFDGESKIQHVCRLVTLDYFRSVSIEIANFYLHHK